MLRRRLFAYAITMATGIIGGYYILEKSEIFFGSLFIITVALGIRAVPLDCSKETAARERMALLLCLAMGYMCFSAEYVYMNGRMLDSKGKAVSYDEISSISGRVESITSKDEGYRILLDVASISGMRKLQASYFQDLPTEDMHDLIGDDVTLYGTVKKPAACENPGCFNYKIYLNSRGIRYTMSAKLMRVDGTNNQYRYRFKRVIFRVRDDFLNCFDEDERAFLKGVIFGDKSDLSDDTINEFNINSTGHILAVSGLHIGFLFTLLKALTRKHRGKVVTAMIIVVILLYGEMTMWSPSTVRAVVVTGISLMSIYARRPFDLLSSVSAAAVLLLIHNPYNLFNSGFQMSFMALLGICFMTEPLSHLFGDTLAMMVAVQTAIAPMVMYNFNAFNVMTMFINIPIVYLASILVPMTIISLLLMIAIGCLPEILINAIEGLSGLIVEINSRLCFDGLFYNNIPGIRITGLIFFYALLFLAFSEWTKVRLLRFEYRKIAKKLPLILAPILCLCIITGNTFANDELIFVSVGQGDCCHIRDDGHDVLIDGGGNVNYNIGRNVLRPYLLKSGAESVDAALLTHLHTDHYRGIYELNNVYPIGKIGVSSAYTRAGKTAADKANKYGVAEYSENVGADELPTNAFALTEGNRVSLSNNVYIEPIWPIAHLTKTLSLTDANENNMVFMVHYGKYKIMITGDMLEEDEIEMVEYYRGTKVLKADVLKVCHHGSKSSSSEIFLDAVNPQIAVISVGANNMYGHPSQQTLDRLTARGIRIYRTDEDGAVGLDIRKKSIHVDTMT